jgi:hypothetical protein
MHLLDGYHINKIYANIKSIEELNDFSIRNFVPQKKAKENVNGSIF